MAPSTRSGARGGQPAFQLKSDLQRQRDNYGQKLDTSWPVDELRLDQGPRGFTRPGAMGTASHMNHHNTVYQSLMHLPIFVNWIRSHDAGCQLEDCHTCHLKDITNLYWGHATAPHVPIPYTDPAVMAIRRTARRHGNHHISPHSFYPWLTRMANLRDPINASWNHEAAALFEIVLNETRTCQICNRTHTARRNEQMLEVDYDSINHVILENMVTEYFSAYDIRQHCPTCGDEENTTVSRTIEAAPQVLRISVNIYKNGGRWKQDDAFDIPETLQLAGFQRVNGLPLSYTLSSTIAHGGLGNAERMVTDRELEELELALQEEEIERRNNELRNVMGPEVQRPRGVIHNQANREDADMGGMGDNADNEKVSVQSESQDGMGSFDGLEDVAEEHLQQELGLQQDWDDAELNEGFSGVVNSMLLFDEPRRRRSPRFSLTRTYDELSETESAESTDSDMSSSADDEMQDEDDQPTVIMKLDDSEPEGQEQEELGEDDDNDDDNRNGNPYASGIHVDAEGNLIPVGHDHINWRSPSGSPIFDGLPRMDPPRPEQDVDFAVAEDIPIQDHWGNEIHAAEEPQQPDIVLTIPIHYNHVMAPRTLEPYWDAASRIEINRRLNIGNDGELGDAMRFHYRTVVVIVNGRRPIILYNDNPAVRTDAPIDFEMVTEVMRIDGESHDILNFNFNGPAIVVTNQGPGRDGHNSIVMDGVDPELDVLDENQDEDNIHPQLGHWWVMINIQYNHETAPAVLERYYTAATHVEVRRGDHEYRTVVIILNGGEHIMLLNTDPTINPHERVDINRATEIIHLDGDVNIDVGRTVLAVSGPRHDRGINFVPMVGRRPQNMPLENGEGDVLQLEINGRDDEADDSEVGEEWFLSEQLQPLYDRAQYVDRLNVDRRHRTVVILNEEDEAVTIHNTNPDIDFDEEPTEESATDVITINGQVTHVERFPFFNEDGEEILDRATVRFRVLFYPENQGRYTSNSPRPPPRYSPQPSPIPSYSSPPSYPPSAQPTTPSSTPPPSSPPRFPQSHSRSQTPLSLLSETTTTYSASSASSATTIRPANFSHYITTTRGHAPPRPRRHNAAPPAPHQFHHVADDHCAPMHDADLVRNPQRLAPPDACPVPPEGAEFQVVVLTYTRDKLKGRAGKLERMIPGVI
ncbi:hypothetical protein J1614_000262 [Plenodomus biglobosus]|nr:hypothetical protein J1614_000262 [Plenodomus biglobosus]